MPKTYNIQPISTALQTVKSALVLLPQNPALDAVAAGLSLYLALSKKPINTTIGCSTPMTVNFNRLFGVDKIKPRIGNQNLVISFNYPEDSLEKVSYDKDPQNQKFHLTIEPKAGHQPLDSQNLEYSYTGCQADLIFVVSARSLEDLGVLYQEEKKLFESKSTTLVNLSSLDKNSQFGTVNIYDPTASGSSEITLNVIQALNLPLESDIATNLLAGIESSTNNLTSHKVTADTFETIAKLMRLGAKKGHLKTAPSQATSAMPLHKPLPAQIPSKPIPFVSPQPPQTPAMSPPAPIPQPIPQPRPQTNQPIPQTTPAPANPSPDWLKPKVFKSSASQI